MPRPPQNPTCRCARCCVSVSTHSTSRNVDDAGNGCGAAHGGRGPPGAPPPPSQTGRLTALMPAAPSSTPIQG
eukprot:358445-Chlamydomonas_euryale.AAC.32